jgi:hypothetical protein
MVQRQTKVLTPVRGRRYRVTRLDACGNPVYGENGQVVTKGVVSAAFTANTSEADEIRVTNSAGETCVLEPSTTSLEGFTGEIQLCGMDPDMFEIMTGMPVEYDHLGVAVGVRVDVGVDLTAFAFALEIWTGLASDDACGEIGEVEYGYILLPFMKGGRLSDFTVENGAINFTVADATSRRGGSWGKGPYCVVPNLPEGGGDATPGPLLTALTSTQVMLLRRTNVAPPAATVGGHPLLDLGWTELATVTATPDDLDVDVDVSPSLLAGEGVYYDFGDDTWDYVEGPGDGAVTHTYDEPGEYTITAQAGGCEPVTTTVTVTEGS